MRPLISRFTETKNSWVSPRSQALCDLPSAPSSVTEGVELLKVSQPMKSRFVTSALGRSGNGTRWCSSSLANLVYICHFTMVYGSEIYTYYGFKTK